MAGPVKCCRAAPRLVDRQVWAVHVGRPTVSGLDGLGDGNRMFDHVPAQPADLREAKLLAQLKQPGLQIDDDVMQTVLDVSHARARRIVTNVSKLAEYALKTGDNHITAADAARIKFDSGSAPAPRSNL
ncbi:MAG: hypothetical protein ACK5LJ_04995 [Paracoccus sp. (in: a-proteobacteria)]